MLSFAIQTSFMMVHIGLVTVSDQFNKKTC